jgi:hypothetical protein
MNIAVSATAAAAIPVASPTIAADAHADLPAQIARLEEAINLLRTCHVCEGWKMDEEGAERALRYVRAGCPDDEDEWAATRHFLGSHNISMDWIFCGDVRVMICSAAARSDAALLIARPSDPIFASIEAHKAAHAVVLEAVGRYSQFEREQQAVDRLQTAKRHEDEQRRAEEIEADLEEAYDAETDAACELCDVRPTTMQGLVALLNYALVHDKDGHSWPTALQSNDGRKTRSWHHFLIENALVAITLGLRDLQQEAIEQYEAARA